ncbi:MULTISPECIES: helix-turn-helix transcriptional regulator [Alicyclobacillus]|uniref:CBS domain-containing protein n=1 Tax=Alicyclobacillus suci TaxID=2816080 RepID=UPI0011BDCDED
MREAGKGGATIELSSRQKEILRLVETHEPIIAEQLAELLGVSKPTIRFDLSLLVTLGYLDAKPKVGYFIGKGRNGQSESVQKLLSTEVQHVQSVPVVVREVTSLYDAVVTLFLEDVGSLIVTDEFNYLSGVVSRKDLLKTLLGNTQATSIPVSMIMTRFPNVVTVSPEDTILDAARKMVNNKVDTLPVVEPVDVTSQDSGDYRLHVVGRVTKTTMTKVLLDLASPGPQ